MNSLVAVGPAPGGGGGWPSIPIVDRPTNSVKGSALANQQLHAGQCFKPAQNLIEERSAAVRPSEYFVSDKHRTNGEHIVSLETEPHT